VQRSPRMFFARAHYFSRLNWPFPTPSALALSSFSSALSGSFLLSLSRSSPSRSLRPCRVGPNQRLRCSRRSVGDQGFRFHLRVGRLLAKSGMLRTCTNRTRKASRMNTCAKRVGGWWPRTTLARKGYLLRRNVYQQDELSPVKRVALFAVRESGASRP
jgi:hypothetical protein